MLWQSIIAMCLPIIGQFFDTMNVASTDKECYNDPLKSIRLRECRQLFWGTVEKNKQSKDDLCRSGGWRKLKPEADVFVTRSACDTTKYFFSKMELYFDILKQKGRQHGSGVRGGASLRSGRSRALVPFIPDLISSVTIVNTQLVCILPVVIFNHVIFSYVNYFPFCLHWSWKNPLG